MILADNETKVDLLNNEAIAKTIVELLGSTPQRPMTIGVHGDWGAGKSSILEMIEAGFEPHKDVLCLKFNGWRFQGFEDAKIALIEGIVTGLIESRPAVRKAADAVKEVFRRIDWLKVAKKGGGLALTAYTGIPTPDQVRSVISALKGALASPGDLITKDSVAEALKHTEGLMKTEAAPANVPTEIQAFRKAFDDLLSAAGVTQLVVLIDDLDRCLPDTAIETLEAVRLFVFTSRTGFVVAADEAMIEYAVRKHFPDLPDTTGPRDYARNYLEKLIQVPFRIPALGEAETRTYVMLLLVAAELGENDAGFVRLLGVAREYMRRPWQSAALDAAATRAALGDAAWTKAQPALILAEQIGPVMASGTRGNPRQIKRFLNTLLLRERTAAARGFGEDIKRPILAKLMLVERFLPRVFDRIASEAASHPSGRCTELATLEQAAISESAAPSTVDTQAGNASSPSPSQRGKPAKLQVAKSEDSVTVSEWLSTPAVVDWARIEPALANTDLRPYLFVSRDRKAYFGHGSALGHLAAIVDQLMGPKLAVQGMDLQVRALTPTEAGHVLEALRARILATDSFDTEPPGVAGVTVLVKAQPTLQSGLIDFLETLPPNRLGPWAAKGWSGVLQDATAVSRFESVLRTWAKAGSQFLRAAATTALQSDSGKR